MLKIQPQYLSLSKLLSGRLFRIPEYQRAYSWTSHQRDDLFGDLRKTHAKGKEGDHFMAAVVCLRKDTRELGTDEYQVLEVVDGQQRLTTLVILLKALHVRLDQAEPDQKKLADELDALLVKPDSGGELLLLQTNHDSSHYFANFLRNAKVVKASEAKTTADREILNAIEECQRFLESWVSSGKELVSLGALLKNRLHFLLHEIADESVVYTVFEVLNSRGLTVSWLDRLKSILMGIAYELPKVDQASLIKDLHVTWRDIYASIGLRQGLNTEALRFAATLSTKSAPSRPVGEEDSVEQLRAHASGGAAQLRAVASWLLDVTRACDAVVANHRLNAVSRISQARLLATAIQLRDDFSDQERKALLSSWEKVTFRIYGMLGNDARTRVGEYVRLAWRVVNEKLSAEETHTQIKLIGSKFKIEDAVDALRQENCYEGWEQELRYFMFKYEEHLSKKRGMNFKNDQWEKIWMASPSDSIEHVLPKSKASESQKHRLGNLVLLPPRLNSKLIDNAVKDKTDAYTKTGLLIAGRVVDIFNEESKWSKAQIEIWENELLDWAKTEWAD